MAITALFGPPVSGKTSLAIDLAFAMSRRGLSVCLLSTESYSELAVLLQVNIPKKTSLAAAYEMPGALRQTVCKADELLYVLAEHCGSDVFAQEESARAVKELLRQLHEAYDCVIVDCTSRADSALAAWSLRMSDRVLMTTGCRPAAFEWHKSYRRAVWEIADKVSYVCVQARESFDYAALAAALDVTPELRLPYIWNAELLRENNRTLCAAKSLSRATRRALREYSDAIETLCAKLEVSQ